MLFSVQPVYTAINSIGVFLLSTPFSAFIIFKFFDKSHSDEYDMTPVALNCFSLSISDLEHFVHMSVTHLYICFAEMSIQVLCPFFD